VSEPAAAIPPDKILLEIVTPKGRALQAITDEVEAPSQGGEFGVLPGHLPLLAALRTGIVTYRVGQDSKRCAVGVGFVEADGNHVLILSDEFAEREGLDPVVLRKQLAETQDEISKLDAVAAEESSDKAVDRRSALIVRENWLAVQLELYGDPPPATLRPYEEFGPPGDDDADEEPSAPPAEG
jgi:F-type H+-transporting ATPase subunit epsilon